MNKTNIAVIGAGGAGNKMLDTLLDICKVYTPIYANTSLSEMEDMKYIVPDRNMLYITNAEGTGRNSELALQIIKEAQAKIVDFFAKKFSANSGINTFYIIASADGGTGSAMCSLFPKLLKRINKDAVVNLVVAVPNLNEKQYSFNNTMRLLNDIDILVENGFVNSVQYIDNNKMTNEKEFNIKNMTSLDDSISINNKEIDLNDSRNVNCEPGYKVILELDPQYTNLKVAIDRAIENNNFLLPNNFDCEFLMVSLDKENYNMDKAKDIFTVFNMDKYDYNDYGKNILVLGGCEFPNEYKELVKIAMDDLKAKKVERDKRIEKNKEELDKKLNSGLSNNKTIKSEPAKAKQLTKKDIDDLMNDDSLW